MRYRPLSRLNTVDLPEPLGPISPCTVPRATWKPDAIHRRQAAEALAQPRHVQDHGGAAFSTRTRRGCSRRAAIRTRSISPPGRNIMNSTSRPP